MRRLRYWIRDFFGFSRSEANGFLILLPLMVVVLFSYPIFRFLQPKHAFEFDPENKKLDSLVANWDFKSGEKRIESNKSYFQFDPNRIPKEKFIELGFSDFLATRIANYRNAGGRFNKAEDLLKIYGMDSTLYTSVMPYISIEPLTTETKSRVQYKSELKKTPLAKIDLNEADTVQLQRIYGIGPVLASRIVKFRSSLGGFVEAGQLRDVYGLDSVTVERALEKVFVSPDFQATKFDLNTVSQQDLAKHPYIRSKLAKNIITYRFQHGSFKEINDLLKLDLIDSMKLEKIKPYLTISR